MDSCQIVQYLKNSPIGTHVPFDHPFETVRAWFFCLKYKYHDETKKIIEDVFVNGESYHEGFPGRKFPEYRLFSEIQSASIMFKLNLEVRDVETNQIVCHPGKVPEKTQTSRWIHSFFNVKITLPENHLLRTIDFDKHVLHKCPCKSKLTSLEREIMDEIYTIKKLKLVIGRGLLYKLLNEPPFRIGGIRISSMDNMHDKLILINESAFSIQGFFKIIRAKNITNSMRMYPDHLFDPEFSVSRKRKLGIDDSMFDTDTNQTSIFHDFM